LSIGALTWLALLGVVLAGVTPGGSYLAALPALAGGLAGVVAVLVRHETGGLVAHTIAGAVAVVVLAPIVLLFMPALGLATGAAPALFAVLLGMVLLPVLDGAIPHGRGRALPAVVAGSATVVCLAVGLVVDQFDARHPLPTQLMYALDADTGQAWWASQEVRPSAWTRQFVTGHEDLSARFPMLTDGEATGPAQAADLPAPVVDDVARDGSTVSFTVTPQRAVRLVGLTASGVTTATVEGRDVPVTDGTFDVVFNAPPADGVHVTLVLATTDPVDLRVTDGSDGLADLPGFRERPSGVGIEGSHTSELVLVGTTVSL
ncbi:MAG TPA: hypothetical protein VNR62_03980, partial [Cellulomonas sp.]|nr:hypothetical protein [Cellulomonas sp.]